MCLCEHQAGSASSAAESGGLASMCSAAVLQGLHTEISRINVWQHAAHLVSNCTSQPWLLSVTHISPQPVTPCYVQIVPRLGAEGVQLLSSMLQLDPAKRISARQALGHPFFGPLAAEAPANAPAAAAASDRAAQQSRR